MASKDRPFFDKIGPLLLLVFAAPAVWLLVQRLPLPWFGNPVWSSVQTGGDVSLSPHISIDLPATSLELGRALLAAIVFLTGASIGVEREDAQWLLPGLTVFATVFVILVALGLDGSSIETGAMIDVTALVAVLALSDILDVSERLQAGSRRTNATLRVVLMSSSALIAVVLCGLTLGWRGAASLLYLLGGGAGTLLVIQIVRRLGLGAFSASGAMLVVVGLSVSVLAGLQPISGSPLVAFASAASSSVERTERMITDAPRLGIGGGAFASLEGLYRGVREDPLDSAPTYVAKAMIELGAVPTLVEAIGLLIVTVLLIKSAVDRTRDWVYAAAGAATLVGLGIASFLNAGPGNLTLLLLVSAVLGLAASQQSSRRTSG